MPVSTASRCNAAAFVSSVLLAGGWGVVLKTAAYGGRGVGWRSELARTKPPEHQLLLPEIQDLKSHFDLC